MLIDAHAHVFPQVNGLTGQGATRSLGYGLASVGERVVRLLPPYGVETAYTPEMLIANLDWAGVDKAFLLQGSFYGAWNAYVRQAVSRYPERLTGFAYLDPWKDGWKNQLAQLMEQDEFAGVKLELSEGAGFCGLYPQARLDQPDLHWLWETLQRHAKLLVLDLGAVGSRSYQTEAVRSLAVKYPGLKLVIAHLGQIRPEVVADPRLMNKWRAQIELGKLPNVWFDCAALPAYLPQEDYPFPSAGVYLRMAVEQIGAEKVMWGTDQPGLLPHASLPELVKMARLHTDFLPPESQGMVLGGNAQSLFFGGAG